MSETEPGAAALTERRAAVADFAAALRQLRLEAGKPSFRAMAGATGAISHTTLHEAASGSRLPSWPTTRVYVQACGGHEAEWHQRWMAAANAASVPETADLRADTGQRPTRLPKVPPDSQESEGGIMSANGGPSDTTARTPDSTPPEPRQNQQATPERTARQRHSWTHALTRAAGALIGVGAGPGHSGPQKSPVPAATEAQRCPSRSPQRYRVLTHLVALIVGAAIGAGTVVATYDATVTATDPAPGAPGYVARIASATGTAFATSTKLPVGHAVAVGDTLVVSMMLTNTHTGTVSATDSRGSTYTTAADQTDGDAGDRTLILTATAIKALSTSDTITVGYPSTGEQHLTVDELTNVKAVDQHASATGAAGTNFNSGSTPAITANPELVFGVAGVQGGTAATWSSGFTALPTLFVSHDQLAAGYKTVTATGTYAAVGSCDHQWMAAVAAFAPSAPPL
ncbi:helix-turn-helix domain-containing protein [Streptomyces sp. NPDC051994]|uniref:helix-turn-helix domain-containing protein n=1 Tax=unclassified Streptomyces TaxID=2593676 RepID=UPI00341CD99A